METTLSWTTPAEESIYGYMTSMDTLRKRMGLSNGLHYHGLEDFVLQHGRFYASAPLTAEELAYLKTILTNYGRRCAKKECFYNSQMLLLATERFMAPVPGMTLRYVEGYAHGIIPVHHGWLTLNGKVIDPTLRTDAQPRRSPLSNRTVGTFPESMAFFGVPFTTDEVLTSVIERKEGGSLLIDFTRHFPFLRAPYTVTP